MLSALLLALPAHATTVDVDAFTSFPTTVGVRSTVEGPARLRLTASGGIFPEPYLQSINRTAVHNEWYDQHTADLIQTMLHNSLLFSVHGGWRPFSRHGLQFEAGYGFVGLGGGLTGPQLLSEVTGYDLSGLPDSGYDYEAHASLHRVEGSIGWEWVVWHHLHVRTDLGYSRTLAAHAVVEPTFDVPWLLTPIEENMEQDAEGKLEDTLKGKVHTPIIALGVGYRF